MRFTILREDFLKPLRAVASVVERKHTQTSPILSNVLIKVLGTQFSLTATDQEVELVATGNLTEAEEGGAVTVSVRKLMDVCRVLPEGVTLSIREEQERIIIRAGRSRFTLSTLPAENFPSLEEQVEGVRFSVAKKALRTLMDQTCFAMAEQDVRYYLNGMLLEIKDGQVYGVAADGHRLAFGKISAPLKEMETVRVIVPRKGILELQRVLDDGEEEINIILGSNHIRAITGEVQLTSKLLEGRFPDYDRLINVSGDKIIIGSREVFKESFQRAAALFSDRFRGARLRLMNGFLKISASNAEQDEVEEDIEVNYTGSELEIGFNIKYLIDFLTAIQTDLVKFTFSDSNSSARVEGVEGESGIYVIMPMRI
jgi:DNA polymerase-3 subunit beta